jgi:heat shock protein HslJ
VKIRVILIICFFCSSFLLQAQKAAIKNNSIYFLSGIYSGGKKNNLCKDKGHIVFDLKLNTAACFTSCNFIQLKYSMKGNALSFTSVTPDKEPCPDPMLGLEEDFKMNFPKVTNYVFKGKDLVLMDKKDTLMIFYEKPMPKGK